MSKKRKTVDRRMISIPPSLNDRMAKLPDVNWSAIACAAFERKLGELAAQKEEKDMEDVIARLRASKAESDSKLYRDGFKLGESWARDHASVAELKQLAKLRDSVDDSDWEGQFHTQEGDAFSAADHLAFTIINEDGELGRGSYCGREDSTQFWERATGLDQYDSNLSDDEFLKGFAEGALDVWDQVKSQI